MVMLVNGHACEWSYMVMLVKIEQLCLLRTATHGNKENSAFFLVHANELPLLPSYQSSLANHEAHIGNLCI